MLAVVGPLLHFMEGLQWPLNRILWERPLQKPALCGFLSLENTNRCTGNQSYELGASS